MIAMNKCVRFIFIIVLSMVFVPLRVCARSGLSTPCIVVSLENLEVGGTYRAGYRVTNTGDGSVNLKIDIIPADTLKEGCEQVPDGSWVQLEWDYFVLGPGEQAITDIIVSIPDKKEYAGKKYQAQIWAHTVKAGFVGVGVCSRLVFTTREVKEPKEEISFEESERLKKVLKLSIEPDALYVKNVKPGVKYNVEKLTGGNLVLVNESDKKHILNMKVIQVIDSSSGQSIDDENEQIRKVLHFSKRRIAIRPGQKKKVKMYLKFPDEEIYTNREYIFIICTEILSGKVQGELYNKLYVDTH